MGSVTNMRYDYLNSSLQSLHSTSQQCPQCLCCLWCRQSSSETLEFWDALYHFKYFVWLPKTVLKLSDFTNATIAFRAKIWNNNWCFHVHLPACTSIWPKCLLCFLLQCFQEEVNMMRQYFQSKIFRLGWGFGKILLLASIIICLKWCKEKSNLGRSSSWEKVKIEWMSQYRLAFELRTKLLNFQSVKNPSLSSWAYFELPGENVRIVLNLKSRIGWMKKQSIFCIFKVLALACLWLYLWRVVW